MTAFHKDFKIWVRQHLPRSSLLDEPICLAALEGDAGFRCYFRLNTKTPLLAVYSPPQHEDNLAFVRTSHYFAAGNIKVPKIFAVNFEKGFMLLQDFGTQLLKPLLTLDTLGQYYDLAEELLLDLQRLDPGNKIFPNYGKGKLAAELKLFEQWFVNNLLMLDLSASDRGMLTDFFDLLTENALEQPKVIVHRDYHSRNLMVHNNELGIIDYQDAVIGPITYDLVSLLKDCYLSWPQDIVQRRALSYKTRAVSRGLMPETNDEKFIKWFDWMGLQRHIKVMGIFARLSIRDNKPAYLCELPQVVDYVLNTTFHYSELKTFNRWFSNKICVCLPRYPWYSGCR